MTETSPQMALPFRHIPGHGPDFLAAPSNDDARAWLDRTATWPQRRLALWGPAGSGKTHLLALWADRHVATSLTGPALVAGLVARPLAIDAADAAPEHALLQMLNMANEARQPVLLAARAPPARWPATLPDLVSRLRAITAVGIGDPEDSLLSALLARLFADRQMVVSETLQTWMLRQLPRTPAAIRAAAECLDDASLRAGTGPTRALARYAVDVVRAKFGEDPIRSLHAS